MKVLIIPEDFRNDQYILTPIFKKLLSMMGKNNAQIRVCLDPLLRGVSEALNTDKIKQIVDRYIGTVDIFVLCVDRDGVPGRRARLDEIEEIFTECTIIGENAWEELETWVLAGVALPKDWSWADVRADISVKEHYFDELCRRRKITDGPGRGRKVLGEEASRRVDLIIAKCQEDFGNLAARIRLACE
ncbi:hypothetical protein [Pleomorphomonas sp. JP5]|uniref:hypothetical protein n=1 Tax=Pleomorphomonas sp. JP5 TaxID=2942998 RepID=UPI0020444139|nr:hypothetical protein [Pleomorphomonas sp. JP5]MCM5557417.1 hypothetical protein [Pleomorphomonas sp. JP5]